MKRRLILGVHSGHDASACLLEDNKIKIAIAKERITRKKHDSGEPIESIDYILKHEGIEKKDIDLVVRCNWFDSKELDDNYYKEFKNVIINKNHHLFHAYAGTLCCKKLPCIIVVVDGRGSRPVDVGLLNNKLSENTYYEAESIYIYDGNELKLLEKRFGEYFKDKYKWGSHLDSLGYAYSALSKCVFGSEYAAGKIMALAAFGQEDKSIPKVFKYGYGQEFKVCEEWLNILQNSNLPISWKDEVTKNMAFSLQNGLEEYMEFRLKQLKERYGVNNFVISGGVGLNCKNNGLLANKDFIDTLGVYPASGDDGLSIGAAIWGYKNISKDNSNKIIWNYDLGKDYSKGRRINYSTISKEIALLLKENKFIGVFTRGSEYGPRALGNRSILCNASSVELKDKLNKNIKHREVFRPFGGIILSKNLSEVTKDKLASPYMISAVKFNDKARDKYKAITHIDGTVRIQVVEDINSLVGNILLEYEKLTKDKILINTSFNGREEPIVETEEEALNTAKRIGLDYLVIEDKLIRIREV